MSTLLVAVALLPVGLQGAPPLPARGRAPQRAAAAATRPALELQIAHTGPIQGVAFLPDGKTLVSKGPDAIKLWDVATGTMLRTFAGNEGLLMAFALSPDGKMAVTGGAGMVVHCWEVQTGILQRTLPAPHAPVLSAAFSPDGRTIAVGSQDGTITLWPAQRNGGPRTLTGHRAAVHSLAFSPDGKALASGDETSALKVQNVTTGEVQWTATLTGSTWGMRSLAFSPDGKTLAGGSGVPGKSGETVLWEARTGALRRRIPAPAGEVRAIAFSRDGQRLASGSGATFRVYDADTGALQQLLSWHEQSVTALAFSPDDRLLVVGTEVSTIKLCDLSTGEERRTLGSKVGVTSVAFSPDGKWMASAHSDRAVRVWDARPGRLQRIITGHEGPVNTVAFSRDGTILASGSWDSTIRLWDARTGAGVRMLAGPRVGIMSLAFSPDGKILAAGTHRGDSAPGDVTLWDVTTGTLLRTLVGHSLPVWCVGFSPDGRTLASGSWDGTVRLWDAATGEPRRTLSGHKGRVLSIAFSPDGKTLVSDGPQDLKLWDAQRGELLRTLEHQDGSRAVAFSPDGKKLASGGVVDGSVRVWDAGTGALLRTLTGHTTQIYSVAFSPDGRQIASCSGDSTICLWHTSSGRRLATLATLPSREQEPISTDWLSITPAGYYDSSPGAARFIQWRVGNDRFPVEAYERALRRPDLLRKTLAGEPIAETALARGFAAGGAIPPQVVFTLPGAGQQIRGDIVRVKMAVIAVRRVSSVELLVNGRPVHARRMVLGRKTLTVGTQPTELATKTLAAGTRVTGLGSKPISSAYRVLQQFTATVPLPAGETRVRLKAIATGADALQGWAELSLTRLIPTSPGMREATRGDLHVLAIGVSRYQNPIYNLEYADADATAFAGLWQRMKGTLYRRVLVQQLLDERATRGNVHDALTRLTETASDRDSVALFFSGHGVQVGDGKFYFATTDIDAASTSRVEATALPLELFQTTLAKTHAKRVFLFLDACHSGSALGEQVASNERLGEALARRGNVLVFASSRGGEFSYEDAGLGHGAFTAALIEGIGKGKADLAIGGKADGKITAEELLAYLRARVPQMTQNRQTPTVPLLYDFGEQYLVTRTR